MSTPDQPSAPDFIPRRVLFGNPDKSSPQLSPHGQLLAYLAPVEGVLNVWVGPAGAPEAAAPVTRDQGRGIRFYGWAYTNRHIAYVQDRNGDENWHVYVVDLDSGETRDLTPLGGRRQPIGQDFEGSPITVPQGKEHVPGLAEALP